MDAEDVGVLEAVFRFGTITMFSPKVVSFLYAPNRSRLIFPKSGYYEIRRS